MPRETTYTSLRENLASVLDEVVDQQETVIVRRSGARDVALIPATELAGLYETAHLLRSPRNARRLLSAIWLVRVMRDRSKRGACWSRRITQEHRLVYRVTDEAVDFLQSKYHY
jgi:antitoxin YefM